MKLLNIAFHQDANVLHTPVNSRKTVRLLRITAQQNTKLYHELAYQIYTVHLNTQKADCSKHIQNFSEKSHVLKTNLGRVYERRHTKFLPLQPQNN